MTHIPTDLTGIPKDVRDINQEDKLKRQMLESAFGSHHSIDAAALAGVFSSRRPTSPAKSDIEAYRKIRIENIALSHEAAIELVRMINADAEKLTWDDFN